MSEFGLPPERSRLEVLGVSVDALSLDEINEHLVRLVERRECAIIAHHNLHSIYIFHHDRRMREFFSQADVTHIDGMAVVWLARLLGHRAGRAHRVTYADWMASLIAEAERQHWRLFYLGSDRWVGERAAAQLRRCHPALQIATHHGYFDASPGSSENAAVLAYIRRHAPHVILVGMGMPRQEHWILDNIDEMDAAVILPCGAAMDYIAGTTPTPPRWAGALGLEWLFRLAAEPRRLWPRYLLEPWFILRILLTSLLRKAFPVRSRAP